jgi:hypothetical protein
MGEHLKAVFRVPEDCSALLSTMRRHGIVLSGVPTRPDQYDALFAWQTHLLIEVQGTAQSGAAADKALSELFRALHDARLPFAAATTAVPPAQRGEGCSMVIYMNKTGLTEDLTAHASTSGYDPDDTVYGSLCDAGVPYHEVANLNKMLIYRGLLDPVPAFG